MRILKNGIRASLIRMYVNFLAIIMTKCLFYYFYNCILSNLGGAVVGHLTSVGLVTSSTPMQCATVLLGKFFAPDFLCCKAV